MKLEQLSKEVMRVKGEYHAAKAEYTHYRTLCGMMLNERESAHLEFLDSKVREKKAILLEFDHLAVTYFAQVEGTIFGDDEFLYELENWEG